MQFSSSKDPIVTDQLTNHPAQEYAEVLAHHPTHAGTNVYLFPF